jgi:cysteine desulfurase
MDCLDSQFGNSGSSTHDFGLRARQLIEEARDRVAKVVAARRGEVIFTSGATESNNLAILGLVEAGLGRECKHVISTSIEHHAVLEPVGKLRDRGFDRSLIAPDRGGAVSVDAVAGALRDDTLLVSVMHVNNETGIVQPILEIAELLKDHPAYFHVDGAQGYGKDVESLRHPRIDLISVSGHKIHGPMGVGALIARRRGRQRPPLTARFFGGGQEFGLRPGTLPVALIAALGLASELAVSERRARAKTCQLFKDRLLQAMAALKPQLNGDQEKCLGSMVNMSFEGIDSEQVIEAWGDLVAISNGAACTSQSYTCSHVLGAMGFSEDRIVGAVRLSWCHLTPPADLPAMISALEKLPREFLND